MAETLEQKMEAQGYLKVSKVSEMIGRSIYTVYRWIKLGQLDGEKVVGHWFVTVDSLIAKVGHNRARMFGLIEEEGTVTHALASTESIHQG